MAIIRSEHPLEVRHAADGRGDWIRTSDLHTPSVMRYQAALRPDLAAASRQAQHSRQGAAGGRVARRRRKRKGWSWPRRMAAAILGIPALYLLAALIGSLVPVNRGWTEPDHGTTVYLADNGVHADIIMPVKAQGLDWAPLVPKRDFAAADPNARWIAFGSGEEQVYLNTPTWWDLTPRTIWSALSGGNRVMHVEYVSNPSYAVREVRLRPAEYRRLWAAIRSDFALDGLGKPKRIAHPGYGCCDAFY